MFYRGLFMGSPPKKRNRLNYIGLRAKVAGPKAKATFSGNSAK
jgi:hypothetical protein